MWLCFIGAPAGVGRNLAFPGVALRHFPNPKSLSKFEMYSFCSSGHVTREWQHEHGDIRTTPAAGDTVIAGYCY